MTGDNRCMCLRKSKKWTKLYLKIKIKDRRKIFDFIDLLYHSTNCKYLHVWRHDHTNLH